MVLITVVLAIVVGGCSADIGTAENQNSESPGVSRGEHERESDGEHSGQYGGEGHDEHGNDG
jgi:hypothetical protein